MDELLKLAGWLKEDEWPSPRCPECDHGLLNLDSLTAINSAASDRYREDQNWEPDWIVGHFHGVLRCGRSSCGELVIISGEYRVDEDHNEDGLWYGQYAELYRLRYAIPALPIVLMPTEIPDAVRDAVTAASRILWTDPNSAGNRLRTAVEDLLTHHRVRRYVNTNGRRHRLSLHDRIHEFKRTRTTVGETLEAVKWIGNQASHNDKLSVQDVLQGAQLFEYALGLLYDKSPEQHAKLVRKINKLRRLPKPRLAAY